MKLPALCLLATLIAAAPAQTREDREAVRAAAMDYIVALYEVKPELIERSVSKDLVKRGFALRQNGEYTGMLLMNFDQLIDLTKNWNKEGKRANDKSPKEVKLLDVQDKTAAAKVTAAWGTDYLHLAKVDGKWMILNVIWQTPPPKPSDSRTRAR